MFLRECVFDLTKEEKLCKFALTALAQFHNYIFLIFTNFQNKKDNFRHHFFLSFYKTFFTFPLNSLATQQYKFGSIHLRIPGFVH